MPYVPEPVFSAKRITAIAGVVLLHIGIIIAIQNGLARDVVNLIKGPLEVAIIKDEIVPEKAPPPPPVKIETPPPFVPQPEIDIQLPPDPPQNTLTTVTTTPPPSPAPAVPSAPTVPSTPVSLGRNFPNSEDYYPPSSKRLGEEGSPSVRVCVGPNGRLTEEPTIAASSGSTRLDEGALKLAKAGRYVPATVNGKPTTDCFSFRIKFRLNQGR